MASMLKKLVPPPLLLAYHFLLARLAEVLYGSPSQKMIVIGVTGTNGKSSTVNFIAQLLTSLGETVGYTSTAGFNIAGKEIENKMKMTMPGRFVLQKMLRDMVDAGCTYAIVETSSQGLAQYRHVGINYDVAVFTNLTPEHIESHGSFEAYKQAKGLLFTHLTKRSHKIFNGKRIDKVSVINVDDEHSPYYSQFPADRHMTFGWSVYRKPIFFAHEETVDKQGATVYVNDEMAYWPLLAAFQRYNALAAVATVASLGFDLAEVMKAAERLQAVAGRFERIDAGQPFTVIVDYAYEPYALRALFAASEALKPNHIIGIHGSAGGGRDKARRPLIGQVAARHEDVVIVTNEDSYDEDPRSIIDAVADGARKEGKCDNLDLFLIEDRAQAIAYALSLARPGDVVLVTGKGSEPVMAVADGKTIPWDDRAQVRKSLAQLGYGSTTV